MADSRRRLAGQLALVYSIVFLVTLGSFSWLVARSASQSLTDQIVESMGEAASLVRSQLVDARDPHELASISGAQLGARVTIIDRDGTVVADSQADPASMENHADRPEISDALQGLTGAEARFSETLGVEQIYIAVPSDDGPIVRISKSRGQIDSRVAAIVRTIWALAIPVGFLGLFGVWLAGRRLARPITELTDVASRVAAGDLEPGVRRSRILELDRLGVAIGGTAGRLGRQIVEVEEQRTTLSTTLANLPQGVVLVEADDSISVVNTRAVDLVGYRAARLANLVPAALQRSVTNAREAGTASTIEVEIGRPPRTVSVFTTRIDDMTPRVLMVLVDVTDQRRVEAMRRNFVGDASHELKTPIAGVIASLEAMRLALGQDDQRMEQFASQAEHSARRLAAIVEDLLDLSRLESSDRKTNDVQLHEVIESEVNAARSGETAHGLQIITSVEPIVVRGDATELAMAVRNLLDNAINYSPDGASILVTVRKEDDDAVVEVCDTGPGIPTRHLGRVFERFYRVDSARSRRRGGTGLGLSLVRHVTDRHGGTVEVESQLGVGSTFTMRLPL